jgi:hypothetical protein
MPTFGAPLDPPAPPGAAFWATPAIATELSLSFFSRSATSAPIAYVVIGHKWLQSSKLVDDFTVIQVDVERVAISLRNGPIFRILRMPITTCANLPWRMTHLRKLSMILTAMASDAAALAYTNIGTIGQTRSTRAISEKRTGSNSSKSEMRNMLEPSRPLIGGVAQLQIDYRYSGRQDEPESVFLMLRSDINATGNCVCYAISTRLSFLTRMGDADRRRLRTGPWNVSERGTAIVQAQPFPWVLGACNLPVGAVHERIGATS